MSFRLAPLALAIAFSPACGSRSDAEAEPFGLHVAEVGIEPDVGIDVQPGVGAGLFLETTSAGQWTLMTACDSDYSGYACDWDVVVSVAPGARLRAIEIWDAERSDDVFRIDSGALQWLALTGSDIDGLTFETDPGEPLRVDVLLDGESDPRFIYWNWDGAVQSGAPSDPVDLVPALDD